MSSNQYAMQNRLRIEARILSALNKGLCPIVSTLFICLIRGMFFFSRCIMGAESLKMRDENRGQNIKRERVVSVKRIANIFLFLSWYQTENNSEARLLFELGSSLRAGNSSFSPLRDIGPCRKKSREYTRVWINAYTRILRIRSRTNGA